jgi:hypothetical protein
LRHSTVFNSWWDQTESEALIEIINVQTPGGENGGRAVQTTSGASQVAFLYLLIYLFFSIVDGGASSSA